MHLTICDFILDIVQNSLEAEADTVELDIISTETRYEVRVKDNGCGMTAEELSRLTDPYFTDGRKHKERPAGLGIPFLGQAVEQSGGTFGIDSVPGKGTEVHFAFPLSHVDTPPFGDIAGLLLQIFIFDGEYEVVVRRTVRTAAGSDSYCIRRSECREALGDVYDGVSVQLLKKFFTSQESGITVTQAVKR